MKKVNILIMIFISMFITPVIVKADGLVAGHEYGGTVNIRWVDAEDKLKMRPDEITIPLSGDYWSGGDTFTARQELTLNKKDATITQDGVFTIWTFKVKFFFDGSWGLTYEFDTSADFELPFGYIKNIDQFETGQLGVILSDSSYDDYNLTLTLVKDSFKDISMTGIFNDDNGRDNYRYIYFSIDGENTEKVHRVIDYRYSGTDDEHTWELDPIEYLVTDIYSSQLLEKVKYTYSILDEVKWYTDNSYTYTVSSDEDGNIIYTINHKAERIKVPITVNWLDDDNIYGKRPDSLIIDALNQYDEKEETVELSKDQSYLELYKNIKYSFGQKAIKYQLAIQNTDDYEYEITGNNEDGFTINATYVGDKDIIAESAPANDIEPPETGDSINLVVLFMFISLTGITYTLRRLKKINNNIL